MTDRDRFESLMRLADFRFARWRDRRAYEWKISAGLWAILAAAAIYLKPSGSVSLLITVLLLAVAVVGHAWFWVRPHWISGEMDIRTAFYFSDHAEGIVLDNTPKPGKRLLPVEFEKEHGGWEFLTRGVCQFQVFATTFLALGLLVFLAIGKSN